ncbi:MAG: hypothetical protein ACJ76H_07905 [Bacteriovoracaceae bacterium]
MKRLIWSAFALSLTLVPWVARTQTESIDDFLGIESEVLPDLEGPQRFTPTELHESTEWQVVEKEVILDKEPLKGQGYSIIPWKGIDPEGFLSIDHWLNDRQIKDQTPDWKMRVRDQSHLELIGKVLKCVGTCPVFRGMDKADVEHMSRILEGDEFRTKKDSYAWIYLMDGSLVRLGAETSVSFHEMIVSPGEIFYLMRLNHGHIYFHPRDPETAKTEFHPETDSIFLPLMLREANLEWYERKRFASQNDRGHLDEIMELKDLAIKEQVERLNTLKTKNNEALGKMQRSNLVTKVMVFAPNVTVTGTGASFNMIHIIGEKSWFRRSDGKGTLTMELRGYQNTVVPVENPDVWSEVEPMGRMVTTALPTGELDVAELLTKRIQTIELAREMWFEQFTLPMIADIGDQKKLGIEHGYRLWEDADVKKRQEFLNEYTRRVETTHLRSVENLLVKMEEAGEKPRKNLSSEIYEKALNHYLLGLKKQYTQKKMRVRETNDLEYYVYLLRNGKL